MMRRLIVMRHAKSPWDSSVGSDRERPLSDRGRKDAPLVGAALVERGWAPDLVLSSDAQRTRETFAGLSEAFPGNVEARFLPSFYLAGPRAAGEEVAELEGAVSCVLLLGHNPGWESLVEALCGEDIIMEPATAVLLSRELAGWDYGMQTGKWKLEGVIYPQDI